MKREALDDRREHQRVDAALSDGRTVLLLPFMPRELIADFSRSLAQQRLLHPVDVEGICRALGADHA